MKKEAEKNTAELAVEEFQYSPAKEELVTRSFWAKTKRFAGKIPFT